jgi:hypothetical protein
LQNVVIVEIIVTSEIVKEYTRFFYVSVGQINRPSTALICHVVAESNVSLLLSGEIDNCLHDALLSIEEK